MQVRTRIEGEERFSSDICTPIIDGIFKKLCPHRILSRAVLFHPDGSLSFGTYGSIDNPQRTRIMPRNHLHVISVGKMAYGMHGSFAKIVSGTSMERKVESMVLSPYEGPISGEDNVARMKGNHPFPTDQDVSNTGEVLRIVSDAGPEDVVLVLISGGTSSLLVQPIDGLRLEEKNRAVREAMLSGADIFTLNRLRTTLSKVKGGGLLDRCRAGLVVGMIVSDVPGDDPRFVGSGPTVPWDPSRSDVVNDLERRGLDKGLVRMISSLPDRPRPSPPGQVVNSVIAGMGSTARAAASVLRSEGFITAVRGGPHLGEARVTGPSLLSEGRAALGKHSLAAYVSVGEAAVKVSGDGVGGRNLEMALSVAPLLRKDESVICLATDGEDGNSALSGAIVGPGPLDSSVTLPYLEVNDSAGFFLEHGGAIHTGHTGINMGDLFILLRGGQDRGWGPHLPHRRSGPS